MKGDQPPKTKTTHTGGLFGSGHACGIQPNICGARRGARPLVASGLTHVMQMMSILRKMLAGSTASLTRARSVVVVYRLTI
jgi:hypothetical protein